jgi:hypothetical protein
MLIIGCHFHGRYQVCEVQNAKSWMRPEYTPGTEKPW